LQTQYLHSDDVCDGAVQEQTGVAQGHSVALQCSDSSILSGSDPPYAIAFLARAWPDLPPHIR